jgi:fermentation-respiration switch protein FrsA (DUF1100 family)
VNRVAAGVRARCRETWAFVAATAAIVAGAGFAPSAGAAIPSVFDGGLDCEVVEAGKRECSGVVPTFDDAPIDVRLRFPAAAGSDDDYPLVMGFHGWGGSKDDYDLDRWVDKGYAAFTMSDRGWGDSCGGQDPKRLTDPNCISSGYNHLMDTRYEVRDAQYFAGLLVDDGLVDETAIGATGGSYGGGISMALAALKNRTMLPDGSLVPWESPAGTPISLAAAAPEIPWSDLAYSLVPNGRTLDYVADAPYGTPVGVMKQSFVSGLYALGTTGSNFAVPGTDPSADVHTWYAELTGGEPYDSNPLTEAIVEEVTTYHSSYYIPHATEPAPLLISNGWTDDLFPADEALRFYNRTRGEHPGADLSLVFFDYGHQRGQNKAADRALLRSRQEAWFDHYLKGEGAPPPQQVETLTQTCPEETASGGPFTAPTWAAIAPGEIRYRGDEPQLIAPDGGNPSTNQAFDPVAGPGACATASATDAPGVANYRFDPAPASGYTLMGSPTVIADVISTGPNSQLVARLVDVDPESGQETLVARAIYRPELTPTASLRQVFQLHPNGYRFAAGHIPKLELLGSDVPYARKSNGQAPISVSNLELRLPVLESPGNAGAEEPAPKVVPPGYELAADYSGPIDTDGDGIADPDDDCPGEAGPPSADPGANGCPGAEPDTDGDGVPDDDDVCPDDPGPVGNGGCPQIPCDYLTRGTTGDDRLVGTPAAETIRGRRGDDKIFARAGADCAFGQNGDDRIDAGGGRDKVTGGAGGDRIKVRDHKRDVVRCGKGRDTVIADRKDRTFHCERVRVRAVRG